MLQRTKDFIVGDGNCMFSALSWHVHKSARHSRQVRQEIMVYLEPLLDEEDMCALMEADTGLSKDEYLARMAVSGAWGDQFCLLAACAAFNMSIAVLLVTDDGHGLSFYPSDTEGPFAGLCHTGGNHYELLLPITPSVNSDT